MLRASSFPFLSTPKTLREPPLWAIGARARFEPDRDAWKVHALTTTLHQSQR